MFRAVALALLLLFVGLSGHASAQGDAREAAASAFDSGADAYRAGDFSEAADWFETAHRYAPVPESLTAAARAHDEAGNRLRAANLALRLIREYPEQEGAVSTGRKILDANRGALVEVTVDCDACVVTLDGQEQDSTHFFVEPEQDFLLQATQGTRSRRKTVHGRPGQRVTLQLTAAQSRAKSDLDSSQAALHVDDEEGATSKPIPPAATYVGVGFTGVSLVVSLALSIDAASGVAAFREAARASSSCETDCDALAADAKRLLDDGHARERRTNIAWATTGGLALATAVVAIFLTDWDGDEAPTVAFTPVPGFGGGKLQLQGSF